MSNFSRFDNYQIDVLNDKKDHFIRYRTKEKPLTYLVGAKCRDGIVIASDSRKVIVDNRPNNPTKIETGWKIIQLDENLVIGGAGDTRLFKQFLNELNERLQDAPPKSLKEYRMLAEDTIYELSQRYCNYKYPRTRDYVECFIAIRDIWKRYNIHTNNVKLYALSVDGSAMPVDGIESLGSGWTYGEMFLKMFWNNSFSMRKTVELVQFILNIIDQHNLDIHVDHRLQYYYIPYKAETQNTDMNELTILYNNVGKMHDIFNKAIDEINDIRYDDSRKELDEEYKKRHNMEYAGEFEIDNQKKNSKTKPKSKRTIS